MGASKFEALLRVAKLVQRDLKTNSGQVSIIVEAELDDVIIDVDDTSETCAACGLPFLTFEFRTLQPDGSTLHDEGQPASMRRCRDALLARLAR